MLQTLLLVGCSFPTYQFRNEICDNGLDDNENGLIDCADPECKNSGWSCVTSIPDGWTGPVAFWSGARGDAFPGCSLSGGYTVDRFGELVTDLAVEGRTCPQCSCGSALSGETRSVDFHIDTDSNTTCAFAPVDQCPIHLVEGCQSVNLAKSDLLPDVLKYVTSNGINLRMNLVKAYLSGGSCAVIQVGAKGDLSPSTGGIGHVCKSLDQSGLCPSNDSACVKKTSADFGAELCIFREGLGQTCPSGWANSKPPFYKRFSDDRDCTECTCPFDEAKIPQLDAQIWDYGSDSSCQVRSITETKLSSLSGSVAYFAANAATEKRYFKVDVTAAAALSCKLSGSVQTGAVTGVDPVTICCTGN